MGNFSFIICLIGVFFSNSYCSYWHPEQVQWVGDSIKDEVENINFCNKSICVADASRMGMWVNETANPCDNFYRYVCGSMLHYQALNDRYPFQGLQQILYETINEQRRKVLSERINADDIRPHKIAKSLFQKCVNSRKIKKFGRSQIKKFMDSVGGFPMIDGSAWNSSKFNRSQLFVDYPLLMFEFFNLAFEVKKIDENSNLNFVFAQTTFWYKTKDIDRNIVLFKSILENYGLKITDEIVEQLAEIKKWMHEIERKKFSLENLEYNLNKLTPIAAFNEFMNHNLSNLHVDWKKLLCSLLNFEVDDDFLIVVKNGEILRAMIEHFGATSDRIFANFFNLQVLIDFHKSISLYFLSEHQNDRWGVLNAVQRFEQCIEIVRKNLPVAFTSLLVKKFTNQQMIEDANEIAHRTLKLIAENVENDEIIPIKHRKFMVHKLKTVKLVLGYPEELLDYRNVESVYENLNLTGEESFFDLELQSYMFSLNQKFSKFLFLNGTGLVRKETSRWTDYTTEDELETPLYEMNQANAIYYPSLWFQNPYFHPDRPRYYKDSMFAVFLSYTVNSGLRSYMKTNNITSKNGRKNHFDFISLIYENYAKWDDEHQEDQPLPGFLFSNKQLFWFTLIHKNCAKFQIGFKDEFNDEKNAEAYFQETKAFQNDFGCDRGTKSVPLEDQAAFYHKFNEFY